MIYHQNDSLALIRWLQRVQMHENNEDFFLSSHKSRFLDNCLFYILLIINIDNIYLKGVRIQLVGNLAFPGKITVS